MPLKLTAYFLLSLAGILLLVCAYTDTSVSLEEAEQIVIKEICNSTIEGIKLYKLPCSLNTGDVVMDVDDSTSYAAERECWFFYIDDFPGAKFAHPVRYVFVYCDNGEYSVIHEPGGPICLTRWLKLPRNDLYR
jgi:hypothetical protein